MFAVQAEVLEFISPSPMRKDRCGGVGWEVETGASQGQAGQPGKSNWQWPDSGGDLVSKHRVESNRGRDLTLTSVCRVHTHTLVHDLHVYSRQLQTHKRVHKITNEGILPTSWLRKLKDKSGVAW